MCSIVEKDMDMLEKVHQRALEMKKGLDYLTYEERLRELALFSLERRRFKGVLSMHINA